MPLHVGGPKRHSGWERILQSGRRVAPPKFHARYMRRSSELSRCRRAASGTSRDGVSTTAAYACTNASLDSASCARSGAIAHSSHDPRGVRGAPPRPFPASSPGQLPSTGRDQLESEQKPSASSTRSNVALWYPLSVTTCGAFSFPVAASIRATAFSRPTSSVAVSCASAGCKPTSAIAPEDSLPHVFLKPVDQQAADGGLTRASRTDPRNQRGTNPRAEPAQRNLVLPGVLPQKQMLLASFTKKSHPELIDWDALG